MPHSSPSTPPSLFSSPSPLKFSICSPTPADYPAIASLEKTVFDDDPITVYAYGPDRGSDAEIARRAKQLCNSAPKGCTVRMRKAILEGGEIVGWAYWRFFDPAAVEQENEEGKEGKHDIGIENRGTNVEGEGNSWWPAGANIPLCEAVFVKADELKDRALAGKPYAALNILTVLPAYQRHGIGAALLRDGLQEADRLNIPVWLGAAEPGLKLYLRSGFEIDEVLTFDMKPYGGTTVERHISMIRPARGDTTLEV